ncbi:MAG: hypothetical protein AAF487_04200 [Bacteroidota bacterium]
MNQQNIADHDQQLKKHLIRGKILNIEVFNINTDYYVFNNDAFWLFDGGIHIQLEHGGFGWGWNYDETLFAYSMQKHIKEFLSPNYVQVKNDTFPGISVLLESAIQDVEIKWEYYQDINEEFEAIGEKIYFPLEVILHFENGPHLQLAVIAFEMPNDSFEMSNPTYSIDGELHINFNDVIPIKNVNAD